MRAIFSLLVVLAVAGCASVPKAILGQFDAPNGEFIVIKKDGAVLWSPPSKTGDRLAFFGIASPQKEDPLVVPLVVPSASPFLYSKLVFSSDYTRLTVDWGKDLSGTARKRATEYVRQQ